MVLLKLCIFKNLQTDATLHFIQNPISDKCLMLGSCKINVGTLNLNNDALYQMSTESLLWIKRLHHWLYVLQNIVYLPWWGWSRATILLWYETYHLEISFLVCLFPEICPEPSLQLCSGCPFFSTLLHHHHHAQVTHCHCQFYQWLLMEEHRVIH